jgi:lactoylglutathione lyase
MNATPQPAANVQQVVPFLRVSDMERSVGFYCDGLGFSIKHRWVVDEKLRWCWLTLGGASLMLQEFAKDGPSSLAPEQKVGLSISLSFQCLDALLIYREVTARGVNVKEPFVGNSMWVTILSDPDGYRVEFQSPTNVPEETKLSELKS